MTQTSLRPFVHGAAIANVHMLRHLRSVKGFIYLNFTLSLCYHMHDA